MSRFTSHTLLLMVLLLFGVSSSSWIAGYDYPACLTVYSIEGVNFTTSVAGSALACNIAVTAANLTFTEWTNGTNPITPTYTPGLVSDTVVGGESATCTGYPCATGYDAQSEGNLTLITNGTQTMTLTLVTGVDSGSPSGSAAGTFNMTNGTDSIVLDSTGQTTQTVTITKTGEEITADNGTITLTFATPTLIFVWAGFGMTGGCYGTCNTHSTGTASFNSTVTYTSTEITAATPREQVPAPYISFFGTKLLRSDLGTGTDTANTTGFCKATMISTTSNVLTPAITYFEENGSAYSHFKTGAKAYLLNASDAYILDEANGYWWYVPTVTCGSDGLAGAVTVYYLSGVGAGTPTSIQQSYQFNGVGIGMYSSKYYCSNSSNAAKHSIILFVNGATPSDVFNITVWSNNTTLSTASVTGIVDGLINVTMTGTNATNVTVLWTAFPNGGVNFEVQSQCTSIDMPSAGNRGVFLVLYILIIAGACIAEQTMGAGLEAFTIFAILGALLSWGFYIPGAIMVFYFGARILKPMIE